MSKIEVQRFAVDTTPNCVWGVNLADRNLESLRAIDAKFYHWVASTLVDQLETDDAQRAAVALRIYYDHGLETLFSLLAATVQAPECIFGWLSRYSSSDLRSVVRKIQCGSKLLTRLRIRYVTWESLSEAIHSGLNVENREEADSYRLGFATFWKRLASDFLDENAQREYNSLKHGFRVSPGGFSLAIGEEETYGVPCPPENMSTLGGSKFGSSFFVLQPFHKHNFTNRRHLRNWIPTNFVSALGLISMSIDNMVSFLMYLHGVPPAELRVRRPSSVEWFEKPWQAIPGVTESSIDVTVQTEGLKPLSPEDILKVYESADKRDT